jgi:hypothetical protein
MRRRRRWAIDGAVLLVVLALLLAHGSYLLAGVIVVVTVSGMEWPTPRLRRRALEASWAAGRINGANAELAESWIVATDSAVAALAAGDSGPASALVRLITAELAKDEQMVASIEARVALIPSGPLSSWHERLRARHLSKARHATRNICETVLAESRERLAVDGPEFAGMIDRAHDELVRLRERAELAGATMWLHGQFCPLPAPWRRARAAYEAYCDVMSILDSASRGAPAQTAV